MAKTVPASETIPALLDQMAQIEYRYTFLSRSLSELDGLKNDIDHYIEFGVMKVGQMTKLVYKLKRVLNRRRDVKDELKILNEFKG